MSTRGFTVASGHSHWVAALCALAMAAGIAVAATMLADPSRCVGPDSVEYLELAQALAEHGTFRADAIDSPPELYRTPGYPLFLALMRPWESIGRFRSTLLVQLLSIWAAGFLLAHALVTLKILGWVGAAAAACLVVLNPVVLVLSLQLLTEAPFVFACCVGVWGLTMATVRRRMAFAVLSGLAFGASFLIRPIGIVLVVTMAGSLLILRGTPRPRLVHPRFPPIRWNVIVVWILTASVLPIGWSLRNGLVADYWGPSRTIMSFLGSTFSEAHLSQGSQSGYPTPYDEGDTWLTALRAVSAQIVSHPRETAEVLLTGLGRTALGPGEWTMRQALLGHAGQRPGSGPCPAFRVTQGPGGVVIAEISEEMAPSPESRNLGVWLLLLWSFGITGLCYALIVTGLFYRRFRFHWLLVMALVAAVALMISSPGYQAYARFRIPAIPFLAVAAAFGISRTPTHRRLPGRSQDPQVPPTIRPG